MDNTKQLEMLLKNAMDSGFSMEDIQDMMCDIKAQQEEEADREALLDEYQAEAALALADFLIQLPDYEDRDFDEVEESIDKALTMVRKGELKASIKCDENSCSCKTSYRSPNFDRDLFDDFLKKWF